MAPARQSLKFEHPPVAREPFAPKYYHLKHILRGQIANMKAGDNLPSEAELCQAFDVSRTTVRKALSDLVQEGLVYSVQGKGTFVASRKLTSAWVQQTGGLYADMTERGIKVTMHVQEVNVIPPEENIQKELQLAGGEWVVKLVRLRYVEEKPFDLVTNYLPARLFAGLENEDFEHNSLYAILWNRYNIKFARGVRRVEAGGCPADEARLLQIKPNSPILIMYSTMYDVAGQVIEHGIVHQRSDAAQIVINVIPDEPG